MPKKGQTLKNPITGDTFEFIETGRSSNGRQVIIKETVYSKGQLVPSHIHLFQEETFEIISGQLTIEKDGKTNTLGPKEKVCMPENQPHNHYNSHDKPVCYLHTITPALDFDYLFENLIGLTADRKSKNGKFGIVQELVILKYADSKTFLADIPIWVQKILMNTVGPVARCFGYRAIYKKYSGIEK